MMLYAIHIFTILNLVGSISATVYVTPSGKTCDGTALTPDTIKTWQWTPDVSQSGGDFTCDGTTVNLLPEWKIGTVTSRSSVPYIRIPGYATGTDYYVCASKTTHNRGSGETACTS